VRLSRGSGWTWFPEQFFLIFFFTRPFFPPSLGGQGSLLVLSRRPQSVWRTRWSSWATLFFWLTLLSLNTAAMVSPPPLPFNGGLVGRPQAGRRSDREFRLTAVSPLTSLSYPFQGGGGVPIVADSAARSRFCGSEFPKLRAGCNRRLPPFRATEAAET